MKRWQDRGEVLDSDDEELTIGEDSQSPEQPRKRANNHGDEGIPGAPRHSGNTHPDTTGNQCEVDSDYAFATVEESKDVAEEEIARERDVPAVARSMTVDSWEMELDEVLWTPQKPLRTYGGQVRLPRHNVVGARKLIPVITQAERDDLHLQNLGSLTAASSSGVTSKHLSSSQDGPQGSTEHAKFVDVSPNVRASAWR
jgi:hypothetical protein